MVVKNKLSTFFLTLLWFILGILLLLKGLCMLMGVILSPSSIHFPLVIRLLLFMGAKEVIGVFFIVVSFFMGFSAANLLKIIRIDYKKIKNQKKMHKVRRMNLGLLFSLLIFFTIFNFFIKAFSLPEDIIGILYTTLGCFFMVGSFRLSFNVLKLRYL